MNKITDYDFSLPKDLIADMPSSARGDSRLLVLQKDNLCPSHDSFNNISKYFNHGDVLVLNNTKVMKARILGNKISGGKIEALLLNPVGNNTWHALIKGLGNFKIGSEIFLGIKPNQIAVKVLEKLNNASGSYLIKTNDDLHDLINTSGEIPLPPYMQRRALPVDEERYQTVYAKDFTWGAVAAPTAGLHFTPQILQSLKNIGVKIVELTLHVGAGTFLPVKTNNIAEHKMHSEYYSLSKESADILKSIKKTNKIVAVGTTVVRVLEHVKLKYGDFCESKGNTEIFIKPGHVFLGCNSIITNFHLPKSTLFILICAILGKQRALKAYEEAIENKYKFFSYGDACFFDVN